MKRKAFDSEHKDRSIFSRNNGRKTTDYCDEECRLVYNAPTLDQA